MTDIDTKRCGEENIVQDATFYACRYDGGSCVVVSQFAKELTARVGAEQFLPTVNMLAENLPCKGCRGMIHDAKKLRGLRLGRIERRLLLAVADGTESIVAEDKGRSEAESNLRAARKLVEAGLVSRDNQAVKVETKARTWWWETRPWAGGFPRMYSMPIKRRYYRRTIEISLLGAMVVKHFWPELQTGKSIRWDNRFFLAVEDYQRDSSTLLTEFSDTVARQVSLAKYVAKVHALMPIRSETGRKPDEKIIEKRQVLRDRDQARLPAVIAVQDAIADAMRAAVP